MINKVNLDEEDKVFLKKEITKRTVLYLILFIISSTVVFGIVSLYKIIISPFDPTILYICFTIGYVFFVLYKLRPTIIELNNGVKNVLSGIITDKKENVKYLWSGNLGADMTSQPVIIDYFFKINDIEVGVDEHHYKKYDIGDHLDIHSSTLNGRTIKISKNEKTT